ncbi:MAG: hypothetical protein GXY67_04235 [Clostridiales bacterium]|mgnify:CR=1 FL=1|nr:hypothetical protein [Clostridiales bacterium]
MRASRKASLLMASSLAITPLSVARHGALGAGDANHILIAGGLVDTGFPVAREASVDTVDCYDTALLRTVITALSEKLADHACAGSAAFKVFGGGRVWGHTILGGNRIQVLTLSAAVNAYNAALTRSIPTALSAARYGLAACSNGAQLVFAGGRTESLSAVVDGYSDALVRSTPSALALARMQPGAASNGTHMIFAGGLKSAGGELSPAANVDAYTAAFTRLAPAALTAPRHKAAAARVGNCALFAGGVDAPHADSVEAYDSALTHTVLAAGLSTARNPAQAVSAGGYALFGGIAGDGTVDAFDGTLTRHRVPGMFLPRNAYAGAAHGKYMLLGGGLTEEEAYSAAVDAYNLNLEHFATA